MNLKIEKYLLVILQIPLGILLYFKIDNYVQSIILFTFYNCIIMYTQRWFILSSEKSRIKKKLPLLKKCLNCNQNLKIDQYIDLILGKEFFCDNCNTSIQPSNIKSKKIKYIVIAILFSMPIQILAQFSVDLSSFDFYLSIAINMIIYILLILKILKVQSLSIDLNDRSESNIQLNKKENILLIQHQKEKAWEMASMILRRTGFKFIDLEYQGDSFNLKGPFGMIIKAELKYREATTEFAFYITYLNHSNLLMNMYRDYIYSNIVSETSKSFNLQRDFLIKVLNLIGIIICPLIIFSIAPSIKIKGYSVYQMSYFDWRAGLYFLLLISISNKLFSRRYRSFVENFISECNFKNYFSPGQQCFFYKFYTFISSLSLSMIMMFALLTINMLLDSSSPTSDKGTYGQYTLKQRYPEVRCFETLYRGQSFHSGKECFSFPDLYPFKKSASFNIHKGLLFIPWISNIHSSTNFDFYQILTFYELKTINEWQIAAVPKNKVFFENLKKLENKCNEGDGASCRIFAMAIKYDKSRNNTDEITSEFHKKACSLNIVKSCRK